MSRSSTLHSAHSPVRGQGDAGVLLLAVPGELVTADIEALGFEELVEESDPGRSDEDRLHAAATNATSSSLAGNLVIGSKDRCGA
jgi:hypothetical protein